jgi:ribose-phosphate pyrophosphokinase
MIIFFTRSAQHLSEKIILPKAHYSVKQFSDGELYVKIDQDLDHNEIWIITSTQPPAENLLELFFLLDALVRKGVQKINLFFTYFAYARQAIASSGEAGSAQLICDLLKKFPLHRIYSMHIHAAHLMQTFLPFTDIVNMNFFCSSAKNYDVIAAPDKGAFGFAENVAQTCGKEVIFLKKIRPEHEKVVIESVDGNVKGKKVLLVDDMISTGSTLIEACRALINLGASEVAAAATHGIFSSDAYERLEESQLKKIYVTNTLNCFSKGKIEVTDISTFIESILMK